jgi:hypothetical protein
MDDKSKIEDLLNVSKKYNFFIWMPATCGTTHAVNIFKKFDKDFLFIHSHKIDFFDGHWSYDLISLQRNPYARYVSMFNNVFGHDKSLGLNKVRNNFNVFLNSTFQNSDTLKYILKYHERNPDYFIRLEHLFEDYSKIPFIKKTDFYKSGQLELECSIPKNKNTTNGFTWKELHTPQTADLVYYNTSLIFDLCDYDKDSWKK